MQEIDPTPIASGERTIVDMCITYEEMMGESIGAHRGLRVRETIDSKSGNQRSRDRVGPEYIFSLGHGFGLKSNPRNTCLGLLRSESRRVADAASSPSEVSS